VPKKYISAGRKRRAALRYFRWRLSHPFAAYEKYYAWVEEQRVLAGKPPLYVKAALERPAGFEPEIRDFLTDLGMASGDGVVDYGCGSLRFGAAIIASQEPGKYFGLDVVDSFYKIGLSTLPPELVEAKKPTCAVITPQTLAAVRAARPRFAFTWRTVMAVPPAGHSDFFRKMLSLIPDDGIAAIDFFEAPALVRTSELSWSKPRSMVEASIREVRPKAEIIFKTLPAETTERVCAIVTS
jgi:hypothetical protein